LPRQDLLEFQAQKAFRAGDEAGGRHILESLLEEFPRQDQARAHLPDLLRYGGEPDRAISLVKDGLHLDPQDDTLLNVPMTHSSRWPPFRF
jgi:hypothetical protein